MTVFLSCETGEKGDERNSNFIIFEKIFIQFQVVYAYTSMLHHIGGTSYSSGAKRKSKPEKTTSKTLVSERVMLYALWRMPAKLFRNFFFLWRRHGLIYAHFKIEIGAFSVCACTCVSMWCRWCSRSEFAANFFHSFQTIHHLFLTAVILPKPMYTKLSEWFEMVVWRFLFHVQSRCTHAI